MKILLNVILGLFIIGITIIFFLLDLTNFVTNAGSIISFEFSNLNVTIWVVYSGFLLTNFILYFGYYLIIKNLKVSRTIDQDNIEIRKKLDDQKLKISLYSANKINEATLYINSTKKYSEKIKEYIKEDISPINNFSQKELVFITFLKDISKMYSLYEDIELLNLYVQSKEEKKFFSTLVKYKEEHMSSLREPKYMVTRGLEFKGKYLKIIVLLNGVRTNQQYEALVREVRNTYYINLENLIKVTN